MLDIFERMKIDRETFGIIMPLLHLFNNKSRFKPSIFSMYFLWQFFIKKSNSKIIEICDLLD